MRALAAVSRDPGARRDGRPNSLGTARLALALILACEPREVNKHRLDCERISQLPGSALLLTGEQSPLILKDSIYVLVTILPNSRVLDGQHQAADIMALEMDADALI